MTFRDLLALKAASLEDSETPFLDAAMLLAGAMGIPKSALLARLPEDAGSGLEAGAERRFEDFWARRLQGESVAAILRRKEFFGREFAIDGNVLVPRPDTEILVAAALECGDALAGTCGARLRVHDLCTGSGAVAVTLAAERPEWIVGASDISLGALEVAKANAKEILGRELVFRAADLFQGIDAYFHVVTANPPYLTSQETDGLIAKGWKEPRLALDGGKDGLDLVRRLASQAAGRMVPGGFLLIETDALQSPQARGILEMEGFVDIRVWKDLAGLDRVTGGRMPWRRG